MFLYFGTAIMVQAGIWRALGAWLHKGNDGPSFFDRDGPYARMLSNYRRRTRLPENSLSILASEDAPALKPGDLSHLVSKRGEAEEGESHNDNSEDIQEEGRAGQSPSSSELGATEANLQLSAESRLQDMIVDGDEETIHVRAANDAVHESAPAINSCRRSSAPHYLAHRQTTPSPAPRQQIHQPQRARSQQASSSQAEARQRTTSTPMSPHQSISTFRVDLANFQRRSREPSILSPGPKHDREVEQEEEGPRSKRSRPSSPSSPADASLLQPMMDSESPPSRQPANSSMTAPHQAPSCQVSPQVVVAPKLTVPDVTVEMTPP